MQNSVQQEPSRAFEGMVHDWPERQLSGLSSELIYFGKAVSKSKTVGLAQLPPIVQGYTSGQTLVGVAAADPSVERLPNPTTGVVNQAPYGAFLAETAVRIIRKGRLWVKTLDAISDLSASVWIKNTDSAGTSATVTDTTTYAVTDQDGKTLTVDVFGFAAQLVTFSGATTTAAQVAAALNIQLVGCSASVVGGQVVITTDSVGATQTVSITAGTSDLTWAAPVAGTGQTGISADDARGTFRASTASGYTEHAAGSGLAWQQAAVINGVNLALLEVNLSI